MKILALSNMPAYYQVPILRGLAQKLNENFLALFGNPGQSAGYFEPTWKEIITNDHDLLGGYRSQVLNLTQEEMDRALPPDVQHIIKQILLDFCPTIVFTNRLTGSFCEFVISCARNLGAKVIVRSTPNDLMPRPLWKRIARQIVYRLQYRKVNAACAVGSIAREHFSRFGIPRQFIFDSNYCTDEWVLNPIVANYERVRNDERQRLRIPQDATIACFAGRFVGVKRIDMLIEAALRFRDDSDLYFVMAGSGPMWESAVSEVTRLGLTKVLFPGLLSRVQTANLFTCADLLLLPSVYETYGVVVQEAMMFGCAWVTSDHVASTYDLLCDGHVGRRFPSGDMSAFEQAIREMLAVIRTNINGATNIQACVAERNAGKAIDGVWSAILALHS